jgi:hypothetical protein
VPDANSCQAQPERLLLPCGDFCLILENGLGEIFSIFSEALFAPASPRALSASRWSTPG